MNGATVIIQIQGLDEAKLKVTDLGDSGGDWIASARIAGDGVDIRLLDDATHVRRVLTDLLAQLDTIDAERTVQS